MSNSVILLSLAGILSGLQQITSKLLTNTNLSSDSYSTASLLMSTFVSVPFLFFDFQLAKNQSTWILIAISVVVFALSTTFGFGAYKRTDVSAVSILQRLGTVFTFILGIVFLQESFTTKNLYGIILITLGSVSIIYRKPAKSSMKGMIYAILMTLFGAIAAVLDKKILSDFSPYTYVFINNLLVGLVFIPRKGNITQSLYLLKTKTADLFIRSLFANGSFVLVLLALKMGAVSTVMPIYKSISLITPVIIGILFLKETSSLSQKITGLILSTVGIVLMY